MPFVEREDGVRLSWRESGEGPGLLSEHKIRLAMAIRSTNAHWKMKEIQRRHWLALGKRHGVLSEDGRDIAAILDDLVARTPGVIADVQANLPKGFPDPVAGRVLQGLERAARQLAGG